MFHTPYTVFISYPDEDKYYAFVTKDFLNLMDVECRIAEHQKDAGEELWDKITTMTKSAARVLLLYTAYAPNSDWMKREIHIARTLKRKFIPIREEELELPAEVRGEDREYIPFKRNEFASTLYDICRQVYEFRDRTPHVFRFTANGADTKVKLMVTPRTNQAYWCDAHIESLVTRGTVQMSDVDFIRWTPDTFTVWARMQGLQVVARPPIPDELEL